MVLSQCLLEVFLKDYIYNAKMIFNFGYTAISYASMPAPDVSAVIAF